jgi:hypothetical protein
VPLGQRFALGPPPKVTCAVVVPKPSDHVVTLRCVRRLVTDLPDASAGSPAHPFTVAILVRTPATAIGAGVTNFVHRVVGTPAAAGSASGTRINEAPAIENAVRIVRSPKALFPRMDRQPENCDPDDRQPTRIH